jgi:UDPglucose 6-dehydrogenase
MKNRIVGVIGLGSVGRSVKYAFSSYYPTCGYDILGSYSWEVILESSMLFICVPTPEGPDGRLDCSIVANVLEKLSRDGYNGIIVIKSTVGVGFMDTSLQQYPELRIVYMPEFLREKDCLSWFIAPDRLVISGNRDDIEETLEYFDWVDEDIPRLRMSNREAEIAKLAHNAFIAVKVSFTNEIETICRDNHADPEKVMSVIWADRRVKSKEHLKPNLGPYGGKCVPKDTRELMNASNNSILLRAAEIVNEHTLQRYNSVKMEQENYIKSRIRQV